MYEILLLEADPLHAGMFSMQLQEALYDRFKLKIARNLKQTLEVLGEKNYDLVLLNLGIRDCYGVNQVLNLVKEVRKVPVAIFVEDSDHKKNFADAELPVTAYLQKEKLLPDYLLKVLKKARSVTRHCEERVASQNCSAILLADSGEESNI